jgi:MFS family permease
LIGITAFDRSSHRIASHLRVYIFFAISYTATRCHHGQAQHVGGVGGHQDVPPSVFAHRRGFLWWNAVRLGYGSYRRFVFAFAHATSSANQSVGVLTMDAFQHSFNLDRNSADFANLQGNIVSVLQAGCFFGALASFYVSDTFGRKWALIIADIIFIIGSLIQTLCGLGTTSLTQLYIGRVIGGFGVGLISAVVPTYIGENAPRAIRGRCIGCMV